jgi:predicted N-acetyltransferase YhbS
MPIVVTAEGPVLERILDSTHEIWHEGLNRQAYGRYYLAQRTTPWGRAHLHRFALVDRDEVLASAKLYTFRATCDGRPIRVAGIGALFTPPAHRRRGAAKEVLGQVLERAALDGADVALLFSEIGPDYYAGLGFEPLRTFDLRLHVIEDTRRGAPATMVRAGDERDLSDIVGLDASRAQPFRWHLDRDRDLVHYAIARKRLLAGLASPGARELQFFIAEEGASAVAYVVISVEHRATSTWTIEACGDRDPAGARLGAILQVLVAREPSAIRPAITAWLPPNFCPPQIRISDRSPSRDVMMTKPLTDAGRAVPALGAEDICYWKGDAF